RFGDKAHLLAAVVGEDERSLQDAVLSAPPPLGPGDRPVDRLIAFLDALADLTERNLDVLLATDSIPPGGLAIGAYQAWRLHAVHLLADARPALAPEDAGWHADVLLAPVDPALYASQLRQHGLTAEMIKTNLRELAARVLS